MTDAAQVRAAFGVLRAVADTIREAGEIPAGHLYAALMAQGASQTDFEALVGALVRAGLVARPNPNTGGDVLRWVGPQLAGASA